MACRELVVGFWSWVVSCLSGEGEGAEERNRGLSHHIIWDPGVQEGIWGKRGQRISHYGTMDSHNLCWLIVLSEER